ncbi:hypothetical protein [Sphingomonas jatrophae]|uniref:(2Fe-2S) ferredoxin n=1 Tax=Sphingomonas jatrophae TaxID=1166337 RepID=A0A1I6L1C9_9SPHN|nr:hypothetical protein [Sphingomonas jatrophae]SFR97088.1 hypothetical protein SAMN05192580_2119 [Sphingomonas jatrophae]
MKDHVRADWRSTVLVCRKCSKKQSGGFGPDGDERLAKALARAVGGGRKRKAQVGVVEVDCLGICPKHAVVAVDAAHPGRWQLIRPGTPMDEVAERLGLIEGVVKA